MIAKTNQCPAYAVKSDDSENRSKTYESDLDQCPAYAVKSDDSN